MKKNLEHKKIADMELDNVSGGAHTCYSSDTYAKLNITCNGRDGQKDSFHPVITTVGNSCRLGNYDVTRLGFVIETCNHCIECYKRGATRYCGSRSKEVDKAKNS